MNVNRSGGGDDSVVDDLRAMNAPADVIEKYQAQKVLDDDCLVFEENWQAVLLFMAMGTQWNSRLVGSGDGLISIQTGLNYSALEAVMCMRDIENKADAFDRVGIMELAALEAMIKT